MAALADRFSGGRRAGRYLGELLAGPYRDRWLRRAGRLRSGGINKAAVAQVIAEYLWECGEQPELDRDLPRRLKDRVARALGGEVLSPATLVWFIDAFEMTVDDAARLWALLCGAVPEQIRVPDRRNATVPPAGAAAFCPSRHRTTALQEMHWLGCDGLPVHHRTIHVIEATEDGLDRYPYLCDTNAVMVEVVRGGRAGPIYVTGEGLYALDILLPTTLRRGQDVLLEYRTTFNYRTPPPPEFRRAAERRIENLTIRVAFHQQKVPRSVWWAAWDDYRGSGTITSKEPVRPDADHAVRRFLTAIERTVVGYTWEW